MVSQLSRTAIVSTLLVAIALSSLILSQPTSRLQDALLVSVRNNDSALGLDITLTSSNNNLSDVLTDYHKQTLFVANRTLSSQCGKDYFRCRDLFVERRPVPDGDGEVHIVFIPLENGVLLLSVWYDLYTEELEWSTFIVDSPTCSPTVIYKAACNSSVYTVCINVGNHSNTLTISVYELTFNGSRVGNGLALSLDPYPLISLTYESDSTTSNLSNIVVDVSSEENRVYFALGSLTYFMNVIDATNITLAPLPDHECDQIDRLVLIESNMSLVAYCTDVFVIYNPPSSRDWSGRTRYSVSGIPFLCPNRNYKVWYHEAENSLQLSIGSIMTPMVINNVDISSGVCFEVQNEVYFMYSDQLNGNFVYVYNFVNNNKYPISPYNYNCTGDRDCPHLLIIENHFLVIQTEDNVAVLNAEMNFSVVINTTQEADLLTVLSLNETKAITPAPPSRHTTITSSPMLTTHHAEISSLSAISTTNNPLSSTHTSYYDMHTSYNDISTTMKSYASLMPFDNDTTMVLPYASLMPFDNDTTTALSYPTVNPHRVAILTSTFTIGAIIVISALLIIGICIKFRKKWCLKSPISRPRLRFVADKVQSIPMIRLKHQDESASTTSSTDSDGQEDNYELELGENSYELQSLFGKGWRVTTTL